MTLVLAEAVKNINIAVVQINSNKLFLHDGLQAAFIVTYEGCCYNGGVRCE